MSKLSRWSKFSTPSSVSNVYDNSDSDNSDKSDNSDASEKLSSLSSSSTDVSTISNFSDSSKLPEPFVSNSIEEKRNIRILIVISILIGIGLGSYRLNKYIESIESKKGDAQKEYENIYDYNKKEWKDKIWLSISYLNVFLNALGQMVIVLSSIFGILYFTMYLARKMAN